VQPLHTARHFLVAQRLMRFELIIGDDALAISNFAKVSAISTALP
jgi:hypothetical protein